MLSVEQLPQRETCRRVIEADGFTRVKAMYVETNFAKDWIEKGYPVEAGTAKQ
jgi:hypothetical protein